MPKAEKTPQTRREPPRRSILEEVGNAVTHGIGALAGIAGLVLLILFIKKGNLFRTTPNSPVQGLCSVDSLFNFGMITLYICCIALTVFIMLSGAK